MDFLTEQAIPAVSCNLERYSYLERPYDTCPLDDQSGMDSQCGSTDYVRCERFSQTKMTQEDEMKIEIMQRGPITSKMLVFEDLATEYQSGVYSFDFEAPDAFENELIGSHAVLIVGWGVHEEDSEETEHWIVKNSWGSDWGEDGYFKIKMGDCFLAQASYEGAFACDPIKRDMNLEIATF